jgi:heme exporter protein A
MMDPAVTGAHRLSVAGLSLSRGRRQLFSDVSWQLHSGEVIILRGANGSGKTSLLRVLSGLTAADAGEVKWDGVRWTPLCLEQRAASLYLGHVNALKDELSAAENLAEALAFDGIQVDLTTQIDALDRAGLAGRYDLPVRRLSQGQKRRIGLARMALSAKPLWLLDEPTNALDVDGVSVFVGLVAEHLRRGGVACIATHLSIELSGGVHELVLGGATK